MELKHVTVKPKTNHWGGVEYNVHDKETGVIVSTCELSDRAAVWKIAERIDAQISAEIQHGGYLGPNQ